MLIFPATDICGGQAVRLLRGDYNKMTVYGDPLAIALGFAKSGAEWLHAVDLEGARDGGTPNFGTIQTLTKNSGLKVQVGGGIRSKEVIDKYLDAGVSRVILGTAAIADREFLTRSVTEYGDKIAVGVDIRDGKVAVKGWTELSEYGCFEFCDMLQSIGVQTVICTDISKDGALSGTNTELYDVLSKRYSMNIIASGGVTSPDDIRALKLTSVHGAIIGKALYSGEYSLADFIEETSV